MNLKPLYLVLLVVCFAACSKKKAVNNISNDNAASLVKYATGLAIVPHNGWTEVVVKQPWQGAREEIKYALVEETGATVTIPAGYKTVKVPLQKVAATSTTHLPHFENLAVADRLKGFANADYVYSPFFREKLNNNSLIEIGDGTGINFETCLNLQPEAVFTFSMGNDRTISQRLEQAGIAQLYNADYLETTPLGRAEWIKFTAAFFGKLEAADSVFSSIEENYLQLKQKGAAAESKPTVLTGVVYGETWFLPGGSNYGAVFFEDAGGEYLWNDSEENGWLELSFESVYEKAADADYWIGTASFGTKAEMVAQENRYDMFRPIVTDKVYNYDNQVNSKGGNNYLEEGYSRPDLVLADLLYILHPEQLPGHKLYFYRKLP